MGQMVSAANSGADIRRTERDKPIYLHVVDPTTERSRWYSIEDEGRVQEDDDEDDDDDPILLPEEKEYYRTTDRLRRVQVPGGLPCNRKGYQYYYRHVVLNDTIYAMGAVGYRCYNLLEKQQSTSSSGESSCNSNSESSSSEEAPNMCAEMVKYRANLISEFSQISEVIKKISEICSERDYELDCAVNDWKVYRQVVSRTARSPMKVRLEGFKLLPIWPLLPSPSEESDYSGWQCSAVAFDNGWIYALGLMNWSLEVRSGKRLDLPKPELPPDTNCTEHDFRLLGATKTKLFAYFRDAMVGDTATNLLFCLDLQKSQSQSQRWLLVSKLPWRGQFSTGVVREYGNGDSYLFCCGIRDYDGYVGLYVFNIKYGVWLRGPVEGGLRFTQSICIPFLVDIGHEKVAAVWDRDSGGGFTEVHWCKFTIINSRPDSRNPTFCTQLVSRGARRIFAGDIVDCTPGMLLSATNYYLSLLFLHSHSS